MFDSNLSISKTLDPKREFKLRLSLIFNELYKFNERDSVSNLFELVFKISISSLPYLKAKPKKWSFIFRSPPNVKPLV